MPAKKKNITSSVKQVTKSKLLLVLIPSGVLLVLFGFWLHAYTVQSDNVRKLQDISGILRTTYQEVLAYEATNVDSSSFIYRCGESSVVIGKGQVRCGPSGEIVVNNQSTLENNRLIIVGFLQKNDDLKNMTVGEINDDNSINEDLSYVIRFNIKDSDCLITNTNLKKGGSIYTFDCRMTVPDYLPGYTVEK